MGATLKNSANILIKDSISNAQITAKHTQIAQNIAKTIKIDGFRKGKVPLSVINSRYKDRIQIDSQNEALNDNIKKHLEALKIEANKIIGNPHFKKFDKNDDGIEFELILGLIPNIDLSSIEAQIPSSKIPEIQASEIENRLSEIAQSYGDLSEIEKPLENGLIANIDFEGFVDGANFDGGSAQNYNLEIGSKSFIEGFESGLIGAKVGDNLELNLTFPENYVEHLKNKPVLFKVKINKIQQRIPAKIDDELAKKAMNKPDSTIDALKDSIKIAIENEKKNKIINDLKPELVENLIKNIVFDVPDSIVEQEMDMLFRNAISTLKEADLKEIQNDETKAKAKREESRDEAIKSVKLTFIIDALAKKDKVEVSDNEIYQMIYYEAMMSGGNPKDIIEFYEKNNAIPALKMSILENKILNKLLLDRMKGE